MQYANRPHRAIIKRLAETTLGWRAAGLLRKPGVLTLVYHRIGAPGDRFPGLDVSAFRAQMEWLAAHCTPISPDQLRDEATAAWSARPPVLVTFDDGYISYRERAYPLLKELGIPALLFVSTAYIDEPTRLFWWDVLRTAAQNAECHSVELPWAPGSILPISDPKSRQHLLATAKGHLKNVPAKTREPEVARLLDRLGTRSTFHSPVRQMLDWEDVKAVLDITHLGAHSHTHAILSSMSDEELEIEIAACQDRIRSATGRAVRWFAYPNGRMRDFDDRSRAALLRHGFDTAFTTVPGVTGKGADWMALPRFAGGGTVGDVAWQLSVGARS
jgi:peptidoglycan/xylan/chitin deacetylase (PgdA/CDA1 family)